MKLIILAVFFIFGVVTERPPGLSDTEWYNLLRAGFAQTNSIPNMWKLEFTQKIDGFAHYFLAMNPDCTGLKPGANHRFFFADGDAAAQEFDKYWLSWFDQMEKLSPALVTAKNKEWEKTTAHFLEYVNPIQREISCLNHTCKVTPEPNPAYPKVLTYKKVCFVGPYPKLGMYLPIDSKSGKKVGSECGPKGRSTSQGLCVPK